MVDTSGFTVVSMPQGMDGFQPVDVDRESGASYKARALVGMYDGQEKQLDVLKRFYPDAKKFGTDNFIFTDPKSGKVTLFNPAGMDIGDVMGLGRDAATIAGSTLGAVAGTVGASPGVGTVLGAGAGGYVGGLAADKIAEMFGGPAKDAREMAKSAAMDFGLNAAGQGAGNILGKLVGPSVSRLTGKAGDEIVSIADRLGIPMPTRGTAYQDRSLQNLEQAVSNTFGGAKIMEDANRNTLNAMRSGVDSAAGSLGPVARNAEDLGASALAAAQNSTERLRQEAASKFGAVYGGIEDKAVPSLENTQRTIMEMANSISDPLERKRFLDDATIKRALNLVDSATSKPTTTALPRKPGMAPGNVDPGAEWGAAFSPAQEMAPKPMLDVQTLRNAITDMRQRASIPGSAIDTATASEAQTKGILSALAQDRDAAVSALGRGPELQAANQWYGQEKSLRSALEGIFGREYAPIDLELLMSGKAGTPLALNAADVGKKLLDPSLPNNVQQALQAALRDEYGGIAATRLARMADATSGAQGATGEALLSPSTLLTNWNKSAKTGGEAVVPNGWSDYLTLAAALKDAEKMANTSGTARALGNTAMISGAGGTLAGATTGDRGDTIKTAAGAAVAPWAVAALLANPKFATSPQGMRIAAQAPGLFARMFAESSGGRWR